MTVWKLALAGVVIAGLLWAGGRESVGVGAQMRECVEAMNWELQSGSFGAGSFYAIKLNRCTGATVVLLEHSEIPGEKGVDDDAWLILPERQTRVPIPIP